MSTTSDESVQKTPPEHPEPSPTAPAGAKVTRRALRGGAIFLAVRLAMQLFLWSITFIVARILFVEDFGILAAAVVLVNLADLLAEAGVTAALVQKEHASEDDLAEMFTLSLCLSVLFFAALCLYADPVAEFYQIEELRQVLPVLAVYVLLGPWRLAPSALLQRGLSFGRQSVVHLGANLLQGVTVICLALSGAGVWALVTGALLARFLEGSILIGFSGWRPRFRLPRQGTFSLVLFGLRLGLGSLCWYAASNADYAVVGSLRDKELLGSYALAFQFMALPLEKLTASINMVAYPLFCRMRDDRERLVSVYLRLTVLVSLLGTPVLVGLALVAPDAFPLVLGPDKASVATPFRLLSLVGVTLVVAATLPHLLNALGRADLSFRFNLACLVFLPAGFLVGCELGGMKGVCVAWLVVYPLLAGAMYLLTRSVTGVSPLALLLAQAPILVATWIMAGSVVTVAKLLEQEAAWVRLAVCVLTGAATYAATLLLIARQTVLGDLRQLWRQLRGGQAAV